MDIKIYPSILRGQIRPPPSKSISHRAILMASLNSKPVQIRNHLQSEDILSTIGCLKVLGAQFAYTENGIICTKPIDLNQEKEVHFDCGNSGTTMRLLTGIAAHCTNSAYFFGDNSLNQRPINPLLEAIEQIGIKSESHEGNPPFKIFGPLSIGSDVIIRIKGDMSSQFVSALIFLALLNPTQYCISITVQPPIVSLPYIDLTLTLLQEYGALIQVNQDPEFKITIPGGQKLDMNAFVVPSDFSSVAFPLVASVFENNSITISNISMKYPQADSALINIINDLSLDGKKLIEYDGQQLRGYFRRLSGGEIDISNSPDIFPILAVLSTQAEDSVTLYGAAHLAIKETNRIEKTLEFLSNMGISVQAKDDGAVINPGTLRGNCVVDSYHDHRIAMAASIAATRADSPVIIKNADCVAISYPTFYEDLKGLGAKLEIIG